MNLNDILASMRNNGGDIKKKGDMGEEAVLQLCVERKKNVGNGLLFQSFKYPYQTDKSNNVLPGNVFYDIQTNTFSSIENEGINDEIDILYVTPYRIFAIEVKSYHTKRIQIYDAWMNKYGTYELGGGKKATGDYPVEKSALMQAEKHARHLYHAIYEMLPDGDPSYIQPMVCFVDRCTVQDGRSEELKDYIPACILNTFLATFNRLNVPKEYNLDLTQLNDKLHKIATSIKLEL